MGRWVEQTFGSAEPRAESMTPQDLQRFAASIAERERKLAESRMNLGRNLRFAYFGR